MGEASGGRLLSRRVRTLPQGRQRVPCRDRHHLRPVRRPEYACGFARDISEKKKLEGQLRQAQKMEAVGTLAGGVAHDFNNLLFVIMGCSNLIQAQIGDDDRVRPYIDQVIASSEKAAGSYPAPPRI